MCKLVPLFEDFSPMVADIKRDAILNLIEQAKSCTGIEKIVLFGSSLTEDCTDESDIDFCVIGLETDTDFYRSDCVSEFYDHVFSYDMSQEYDMLYFRSLNAFLESFPDGVVVYSRGVV